MADIREPTKGFAIKGWYVHGDSVRYFITAKTAEGIHSTTKLPGTDINFKFYLAFFHRGAPSEAVCPPQRLLPPESWSENNRKISIKKGICIIIDFAPPPPNKIPGRKPVYYGIIYMGFFSDLFSTYLAIRNNCFVLLLKFTTKCPPVSRHNLEVCRNSTSALSFKYNIPLCYFYSVGKTDGIT